jgi:hypothetical protein
MRLQIKILCFKAFGPRWSSFKLCRRRDLEAIYSFTGLTNGKYHSVIYNREKGRFTSMIKIDLKKRLYINIYIFVIIQLFYKGYAIFLFSSVPGAVSHEPRFTWFP